MFKINNKKHKKYYGFTLVELIIVITILAILATISFVSFSGYTSKSRDSNRLFSLKEISKALEIQKEMTGNYPQPDDIYAYGGIPSLDETLFSVGLIGKNVSNYIKLGSIPLDPKTGNEYLYGVTRDNKNFQIAGTLENLQSSIIVPVTYANAGMQAVVEGNYKGVIKFSTGSSNYIGNIPSIIFSRTGTYDELRTFVINKGKNLPYSVDGEKLGTGLSETEVLKELHNKDSLTLTGVIVTNPKSETEIKEISDKLGVPDLVVAENLGNKEYLEKYASTGGNNIIPPVNSIDSTYWLKTSMGEIIDFKIDSGGNYILLGYLKGTSLLGNNINNDGSTPNFLIKLDKDFNIIWGQYYKSSYYDRIKFDSVGNIYLFSIFSNATTIFGESITDLDTVYVFKINPSNGSLTSTVKTGLTIGSETSTKQIVSIDNNGNFLVAYGNTIYLYNSDNSLRFTKNVGDYFIKGLYLDNDGIYLGKYDNATKNNIVIEKLSTIDGTMLATKQMTDTLNQSWSNYYIKVVGNSLYFTTGIYKPNDIFGEINNTTISDDYVLRKIFVNFNKNDLTVAWYKQIEDLFSNYEADALKVSDVEYDGNYIYDTGRYEGQCNSTRLLNLTKYNPANGDIVYNNVYGETSWGGLQVCGKGIEFYNGGMYVAGNYNGSGNIFGTGATKINPDEFEDDFFIAKINPLTGLVE